MFYTDGMDEYFLSVQAMHKASNHPGFYVDSFPGLHLGLHVPSD